MGLSPPPKAWYQGTLWGSAPHRTAIGSPMGLSAPQDGTRHAVGLTRICTVSSPSPALRASMVNSTGRLAGMPLALSPGPLARTLLASWAGSTLILKGLRGHGVVGGHGVSGVTMGNGVNARHGVSGVWGQYGEQGW